MRRFKTLSHGLMLMPFYAIASLCFGVSLLPGFLLIRWIEQHVHSDPAAFRYFTLAASLGIAYFLYGFTLITVVPFINWFFRCYLKPWRGPYYSVETIQWYIHNGLTFMVRYTFLPFITPTPFNLWFYKRMGMKVGRGTLINTEHITDPSMIELGDYVTIGGSASLIAHYGVSGFLVIAPIKIEKGATIGLRATIMGGVQIGENAKVLPNSVILPKTKIPAGETWGGVPAKKID